jgi:hypothetical protein
LWKAAGSCGRQQVVVGRIAVVVGGTKSEAYLRTKYIGETTPQTRPGSGKNLKRPAFISQSEMTPIGTLSFLVLIPGQMHHLHYPRFFCSLVELVKADSKP